MNDVNPHQSEPATGPVLPPPSAAPSATPAAAPSATPAPPVYVPNESNRLNKVAAWVGIVAGAVFIVAVIFFTGVFVGTSLGDGPHGQRGGPGMMQPGPAGFPMGPPGGGLHRGPEFAGPFGEGPRMDTPRPPGPPAGNAPATPPER